MLKNYLTIALRHLRRRPGYAFINGVGLAVGIAACVLIGLWVRHEASYDRFHAHADRTYRLVETRPTPEGAERVAATAGPVAPAMVEELPGVEAAVRVAQIGRVTVERGDVRFYVGDYLLTEPSFFDVFDFELAQGDPATALSDPGTVVLTDVAARRYFGDEDPLGKTLSIENFGESTVTGVLEPVPETSHLQFSLLLPFATVAEGFEPWEGWIGDWAPYWRALTTYVVLDEHASPTDVGAGLDALLARNTPTDALPQEVRLQPLTDVHLYSADVEGGYNAQPGNPAYLYIFSAVALFIVLIAGINYMNLATARSAERAREIGVRKAAGGRRGQLALQFLGEAVLLAVAALGLGLLLAWAALPAFNVLSGKTLAFGDVFQPAVLAAVVLGTLALGLVAGSYPALYLARLDPSRALKGTEGRAGGAAWLRRGLVVTQFALSIVLIAATLVVARQLDYVQAKRLGFNAEQLVTVDINSGDVRENAETVRAEMLRHPSVREVAVSSRVPGDWKGIAEVEVLREGAGEDDVLSAYFIGASETFLDTYEIDLADGRNFEAARGTDTSAVLLNRAAVEALGLGRPVDATIRLQDDPARSGADVRFRVIGVVEDFHFQSLYEPVRPLVLGFEDNPVEAIDYFTARIEAGQAQAALDHLRVVGERFDPAHPFEYNVLDQRLAEVYEADRRVGRVFGIAAGLAVLIACFGLFGLAAFTAERRTKEIGVRKVLGASAAQITLLLSKEFARLVLIAFVAAAPVAYLAAQRWLDGFAYRTALGADVFLLAGGLALAVALMTVSYHALRAATADPVESLRYE